ncbi:UDP-3-O-(3-hydroxymyristoyl)glucosamine N-acyltransferase [Flagellimonas myxillae]|uniref:UDP-3-O-(3-hydroxymyristoyl)glucosamine N-acyltransferase n=1 Tax=Flagellimonas myxillae TaxID=2942214 RepID=UPI00201F41FC|nr:UDP-3-O-(3-hydroxymyristoyl)glucosamine N-acyltransferase [Muricauda myxillae]MCL6266025.1 UDP-3-O-(3-hydroxymyristoyl)glucosamine N-acyltransferase [Muricauda myxillae]
MKFPRPYSLKEISGIIDSKFVGSEDFPVLGMNEIHVVEKGDIVFVDHPKYYDKALESKASVVLINKVVECPEGKALLISDNPFSDFNKLTHHFAPFKSSSAAIAESAQIGEGTVIQPNVFIGNNVVIGKNCLIHANVSIYDNCIIGDNVAIHSGTVLGSDAFYYKKREVGFERLLSSGRVVVEDHVDIGASCTIDRGVTGDTTIKEWTKLDNQIQIGHDTVIGRRCQIASHTGIAGCVVLEDEVILWGQVGVISAITIGKGAVVYAQSGVAKSLEGGKAYFGSPAEEARTKMREINTIKNLPAMLKKITGNS